MECNRFVVYWQTKRNWHIHNEKLEKMQPVLKISTNYSPNKQRNKSVNHLYSHRNFQIELENKALLSKITKKQSQRKHTHNSQKVYPICNGNRDKKVKYFQNYQKQNQNRDLLNKIKSVRTSYNLHKYAKDYKEKEKIMNLICKFPVRGLKPTKTLLKLDLIKNRKSQSRVSDYLSAQHSRSKQTNHHKNSPPKPKNQSESPTPPTKTQKIKKIYKVVRTQLNQQSILIKGVQYKTFVQLQLLKEGTIKQLRIQNIKFEQMYESCYEKLCGAVRYNSLSDNFYLQ